MRAGAGVPALALALALALGAPLVACSVGEDYHRPDTPIPTGWSTSPEAGGGTWPAADWWHQFGSPVLDGLLQQAEKNNFDLAAAIAQVRQADAQARISGAPLLPSLDAGGGVNRTLDPIGGSASGPKPVTTTTYNLNLTASYELDFWGKNAAGLESAEAAARASRFNSRTVALTMQSSIATSYFDFLGTEDRIQVAKDNVVNAESVLAALRDRLHFGTAAALDVAQQESVVAGLRAAVPPLEQQARQDVTALALLVGQLPEKVDINSGTLAHLAVPAVTPGLPSELLARRPDVAYAEAQLVGANADMTAARAALFPDVTLSAESGFESLALATLLHGSSLLYSLATNFTQPIFHAGALEGGIELKQGRYDELVQDYRKAVVSAFTDVENALNAVRKTAEEENAQKLAVSTAQRAFDISQAQFQAGLVDITTILNTQKTLFSAQDALVQAKLAHFQAVAGLFKALGGGWTEKSIVSTPPAPVPSQS